MANRDDSRGAALTSDCPRRGSMWLQSPIGSELVVKTTCKTWKCLGCRERVKALFQLRVETGCSALGRCALITVTYRAGLRESEPAEYVPTDWRRYLKNPVWSSPLKWLRVMELTKKGTPHHHLIAGPIEGRMRCYGNALDIRRYDQHFNTCDCLSHRLARPWLEITGDSRIVHVAPVTSARGAGAYMAKYLMKVFGQERPSLELGMTRRWSSARGWPGSGTLQLAQTLRGGWRATEFRRGYIPDEEADGAEYLKERSGNCLQHEKQERRAKAAAWKRIKEKIHVD